jgi:hypothetical protein
VAPWSDGAEFEVDEVVDRKFSYGKYKYSVSFKGRSGDHSRYLPRDDDKLSGCQKLVSAYDEQFPFGSLRLDAPSDKRQYDDARKATRKSGQLTNRKVFLIYLGGLDRVKSCRHEAFEDLAMVMAMIDHLVLAILSILHQLHGHLGKM